MRPGLCAALRIQLSDLADVRCSASALETALSQRIAESSSEVVREHAKLGVLLERDPDLSRVRMLLVGAREDHALLAIERIEDRPAPDIDRSLALKVRDTLESLQAASATQTRRETATPEPASASASQLAATLAPSSAQVSAARLRALLETGGGLRVEARTRGAFLLGLGLRGSRDAYFA
ncbi:MAG: hypothetical protein JWN48_1987, partial [Myxococcaceae bacterium]|nr:hypothetical protein [Myxococcaceae bacterium]